MHADDFVRGQARFQLFERLLEQEFLARGAVGEYFFVFGHNPQNVFEIHQRPVFVGAPAPQFGQADLWGALTQVGAQGFLALFQQDALGHCMLQTFHRLRQAFSLKGLTT
jgi:hypothetical protein